MDAGRHCSALFARILRLLRGLGFRNFLFAAYLFVIAIICFTFPFANTYYKITNDATNSLEATTNPMPRILYYNRHSACHANMIQITSRLSVTFSSLHPGFLGDLGMRLDRANSIINDGFVRLVCETADVIIIGDTMPDARPLFQSLVRESVAERCKSNIVLELTTRFDWGISDTEEYYHLIWELTRRQPKNLFWVSNNAFEALDLSYETLGTPLFRMLRPTGHSTLPAQDVPMEDADLALCREEKEHAVYILMKKMGIPFKHVSGGYGGPKTLAKYKAFIEFPYQVSTMKLYENLAAGVVMLLPSKNFFEELIEKGIHGFGPWDKISRAGADWHLYMDYYHPDISPFVYYFDSFEHLKVLLTSNEPLDKKDVRTKAPQAYKHIVTQMLHGWADLFDEMGYKMTVDGQVHIPGTGLRPFRVPLYNSSIIPPSNKSEWLIEFKKLNGWRSSMRTERQQHTKLFKANLTQSEMEAIAIASESRNTNASKKFKLSPDFKNVDLTLIRLLDFVNGELGKSLNDTSLFGGSLVALSTIDLAGSMNETYNLVEAIPSGTVLGPSNFDVVSKLHRAFHLINLLLVNQDEMKPNFSALSEAIGPTRLTALQSKSKRLSNTLYPWAFSKRFTDISRLVRSFQEDYGIVFSVGNAGFKSALLMILHIRENLGCDLPVEVFYNGEKDLQLSSIESLSLIQGVAVKNLQDYFTIAHDRNYHSKPFAILASSFKKVFYLDDDVVLFHSPKTMFNESRIFKTYGSLFFKGPSYTAGNSQWARWFLKSPSITANTTRFFRGISKDEVDASVMLFDKSRLSIVHALLTTCHLNLKDVRESGLDKQLPGDKETYWLALELLRIPYKLSPYNAGAAGTLQILDSGRVVPTSVCGPLAHMNENRKLSHINTRSVWYNYEIYDWESEISHYISPVAEEPGNVDTRQEPWCVLGSIGRKPEEEVFAMSVHEKELLAKLKLLSFDLRVDSKAL